ncbi:MAG: VIT1/CCC1 transporter family protein [Chloroflexota bacterium]|nr:VIT1/CCC1 transporter family protein [Chloroflexota bacterium]
MTSSAQELTRTERNLWSAIAGEALAHLKYNAFAHKALEEGYPEVAQVFQEVAGAETIHGLNHLNVAGEVNSTLENLRSVIEGESREFSIMYPRMIRDAQNDGRQDAADSFALALEREQHHQAIFARALEQLETRQTRLSQARTSTPVPSQAYEVDDRVGQTREVSPQVPAPHRGPVFADSDLMVGTGEAQIDLNTYVAATIEVDKERFRVANLGRLREVVFGAQDGILSTVALVTSVAVAIGDGATILVAGLAAALAGMISMATGAYLGSRAEQDVQQAEIAREAREMEENPAEEFAELVVVLQREGRSFQEASDMAAEIAQDKEAWLRTMVEKELGISPDVTTNPVKDALVMGVSFVVAAMVPIVPYLFLGGWTAIVVSIVAALVGLFVLGMGKGRMVSKAPILQGLEVLGIGAVSAAIGFALGDLVPRLFS